MIDEVNPFHRKGEWELLQSQDVKLNTTKKKNSSKKKIWERIKTDEALKRTQLIKGIIQSATKDGTERLNNDESKKDNLSDITDKLDKYAASKDGREDTKESLSDYLAKKREIFLLQLSINIKQGEMKKLDDKAKAKEEALNNSEKLLEHDTQKFDQFLKDNEKKTQDSIRLAESVAAIRMEKDQHLHSLTEKLQVLQTSINKQKRGVDDCTRFKAFLDDLTPKEWILDQSKKKRKRQEERRRKRIEVRQENWNKEQQGKLAEEIEKIKESDALRRRKKKGKPKMIINNVTQIPIDKMLDLPTMPTFEEDEELTSSDEELPMYFRSPGQLLDIFLSLEEENLSLIQNMQEAEQSLDEMTERFEESKSEVKMKADASVKSINEIKENIALKKDTIDYLKERAENKNADSTIAKQQNLMKELDKKVKQVYRACGFTYAGAAPRTLHMLAEMESKTETIIDGLQTIPAARFQRENKMKEKKRRDAKRAHLQLQQAQLQEERNRKALERSLLPPKKVGKKVSIHSFCSL